MFQEKFLTKFGDDHTTATLINYISNLKENSNKNIKDFYSRFNKFLNNIPQASQPGVYVQIEWYISALPSNIAIFIDRPNNITLTNNMK